MADISSAGSVPAPLSRLSLVKEVLTLRAIACAIALGSAICFANMYLGLQAGAVNAMPMQSALLAFAFFKNIQRHLARPLSPGETTAIEVIAGALGLAPFTSGYTAFIPALEFLVTPAENGSKRFSIIQLLLWSVAICGLGIVIAAPFRRLFILRDRLRYPSATATGTLIGVLFKEEEIVTRADQPQSHSPEALTLANDTTVDYLDSESQSEPDSPDLRHSDEVDEASIGHAVNILLVSLAGSSAFGLVAYFLPILRSFPIFGQTAATKWLWAFDLSPAYIGYGIIIDPSVNICMLFGAIVGWGVLAPIAKHNGWAPGDVDDWDNGSRGWIIWVGMGLILGDSAISLIWTIIKPIIPWFRLRLKRYYFERSQGQQILEYDPLLGEGLDVRTKTMEDKLAADDDWSNKSRITFNLSLYTGSGFILLYIISMLSVFQQYLTVLATFMAVLLVPLAAFVSMRSLGETDNGASLAIGRVAQLVMGLLVPASNPVHFSANLLLGGVVETGASQASQQMGGLKTAYMTRTPPRAVYYAQMIGSLVGTLIATLVYRLYTSTSTLPSQEFQIPDAHLWIVATRLIYQRGLPPHAMNFAIASFLIGAALSTLRIVASKCWWRYLIPSAIAMAIGMYIVPAITLSRALGSLVLILGRNRFGIKTFVLLCSATGLILGQGLFSIIALLFGVLGV